VPRAETERPGAPGEEALEGVPAEGIRRPGEERPVGQPPVREAQENTKSALAFLVNQGTPLNQAWELVREEWLLLPPEEL